MYRVGFEKKAQPYLLIYHNSIKLVLYNKIEIKISVFRILIKYTADLNLAVPTQSSGFDSVLISVGGILICIPVITDLIEFLCNF